MTNPDKQNRNQNNTRIDRPLTNQKHVKKEGTLPQPDKKSTSTLHDE